MIHWNAMLTSFSCSSIFGISLWCSCLGMNIDNSGWHLSFICNVFQHLRMKILICLTCSGWDNICISWKEVFENWSFHALNLQLGSQCLFLIPCIIWFSSSTSVDENYFATSAHDCWSSMYHKYFNTYNIKKMNIAHLGLHKWLCRLIHLNVVHYCHRIHMNFRLECNMD